MTSTPALSSPSSVSRRAAPIVAVEGAPPRMLSTGAAVSLRVPRHLHRARGPRRRPLIRLDLLQRCLPVGVDAASCVALRGTGPPSATAASRKVSSVSAMMARMHVIMRAKRLWPIVRRRPRSPRRTFDKLSPTPLTHIGTWTRGQRST